MPLTNYSVLKGDPQSGEVKFNSRGANPHYQINMQAGGQTFTVAVNIQSDDGSEVRYVVNNAFTPPSLEGLANLPFGVTPLESVPGGLALDFVRETIGGAPMVDQAMLQLLPKSTPAGHPGNQLNNAVVDLLNRAVADPNGTIYAFGDTFADNGVVDGIHDIHMNQGNPAVGGHQGDNGIWQDGGLFVSLPAQNSWVAVFIAFQTESWQTDANGDPLPEAAQGQAGGN